MKPQIKIILILLYLVKDIDMYIERFVHFGPSFSLLIYIVLFLLLTSSIILIAYLKNNIIRIVLGIIFYFCIVSYDSYQRIMLEAFDYNAFINMVDAAGSFGEAFEQYGKSYLISAAYGLLLLIGIIIKPKKTFLQNLHKIAIPIFTFCLFTYLIFFKGGSGALGLPSIYTSLSYSTLMLYELSQDDFGIREDITINRENKSINHDIIYILDESVVANYLDINNVNGVNTSLNKDYQNIEIYNFGYAASIANCSMATNITIRYGGTRQDYKKYIYSKPSMWAYAKNAGLKTIYIDAQRTEGELQNGMTERELEDVDEFIQFDDVDVRYRDQEVAKLLIDKINNDQKEFIFINKVGLHFPIHDKYPDDFLNYEPALPRGKWGNVSDTGSRKGFNGTDQDWVEYRNSYRNTLEWNVGEFFNKILNKADLNKALIFYTADHGQDLHERKNPGNNTHCSSTPTIEEGLVPMVIIQGDSLKTPNWSKNLVNNRDRVSHYNIFPTLLKVMNYNATEVENTYGVSLDMKSNDELTFNKYWNARLGKQASWKKIEVKQVVTPPASDYKNQ